MAVLDVIQYSQGAFESLLRQYSYQRSAEVRRKAQVAYLHRFLSALPAKTIGVETPYTDRDYVEDYVAHYARCHQKYEKDCTRLHFFSAAFEPSDIAAAFSGDKGVVEKLKSSYLGFIVVRPLPETVIGRTCLTLNITRSSERDCPCVRDYPVHVGGISFLVRESLAFQEQDTDVAACATSALWSIFHATGKKFQLPIPPPVEITKSANEIHTAAGRSIPAGAGLSVEQCADAIRSNGLEPHALRLGNFDDEESDWQMLRVNLYGYLRAGLPVLLMGAVYDASAPRKGPPSRHALAVIGYDFDGNVKPTPSSSGTLFSGNRITSFFTHDDSVGPFAPVRIHSDATRFETPLPRRGKERRPILLWPEAALVPLYHKIRVPIHFVTKSIIAFDVPVESLRLHGQLDHMPQRITWDVYLSEIQRYKGELFHRQPVASKLRSLVLSENLPRYVWVASAYMKDTPIVDLIFDATDLLQGMSLVAHVQYDEVICCEIHEALASKAGKSLLDQASRQMKPIVRCFEPA